MTRRREQLVVVAALAALWALFAIQAWQTPTLLDDWVQRGWLRDRGLDFDRIWQVGRYNYLHGNPRVGDLFLLLVNGPRALHIAITPLAQLALLWAAFVVAFGRRPSLALRDLALALVLQVLIWLASPLPGVLYFYRPFATNYLFAFAATLCLLAPYRLALARPRPAAARWWWPPAMLALGWLAGMGNEHTGAAAIAAVAGCIIATRRAARRRARLGGSDRPEPAGGLRGGSRSEASGGVPSDGTSGASSGGTTAGTSGAEQSSVGSGGRVVDLDQDLDVDPHLEVDGDVDVDPLVDLDLGPRSGESSTRIPRTTREGQCATSTVGSTSTLPSSSTSPVKVDVKLDVKRNVSGGRSQALFHNASGGEAGGGARGSAAAHGGSRGAASAWMFAGLLGLGLGYAMLLLAPGQAERYAGRAGSYDALGLIASRGVAGCYDIVAGFLGEVQWAVVLVVGAALGFVAYHRRRGAAAPAISRSQLGAIAALLGGAGAIVVTLFASPVAIERLVFAPAVLVAAALAAVVEHLFALRRLRIAITATAAAIFAYHAVRFVEIYAGAYTEHRQRIAALASAAPGSVASVPPYRTPRSRWYFGDDFRMAGVREYVAHRMYGLGGIELSPRPIWAEPTPPERFAARRIYDPPLPAASTAPASAAPASTAPASAVSAPSFLDAALDELRRGLAIGGWDAIGGHRLVGYQIDATASPLVDPLQRPVRMVDWTPSAVRYVYGDGVEDAERSASIHIAGVTAAPGWRDAFVVACGRTVRVEPVPTGSELVLPLTVDCRGTYTAYLCDPGVCWFAGRFWR